MRSTVPAGPPALACVTLLIFVASGERVSAQNLTAGVDLLFYGDNTEFANPFREGETLLGTAGRFFVDAALNDTVTLRAGFFGKGRYGAHRFLEEAEPVIALELKRGASRFLFGSLDTASTRSDVRGPDEETPHGLLPPLQRETLTFTRAHEMGLQWRIQAARVDQDAWINWQRLNTAAHRERFDAGVRSRVTLARGFAAHAQWHVVHEGGQQFSGGPIRDSQAGALGVEWTRGIPHGRLALDGFTVVTREVPDRERISGRQNGAGVFARGAVERREWRVHLIVWRSCDALKEEGDENYLARRQDGRLFRKVRDYGELGVTRHFRPAPGVQFDASARLHRVESGYEYSYRLVARVQLRGKL